MLYRIVRPIAREGIRIFFRKIYITGREKIPQDKPIIIAANHPTAFAEPCIMACYQKRPLNFLVRGGMFEKAWANFFLRALHMLPVFRIVDGGFGNLKDNYSTFKYCEDALGAGKAIMIMAEGRCIHEKRLRPLRKGTARIAHGTLERFKDADVYIIPTGVNYDYADQFRSEVMIKFHDPIRAKDYLDPDKVHANQAIMEFTDMLRDRMKELIVVIEDKEDDPLVEHLLVMNRSHRPSPFLPVVSESSYPLEQEKMVADRVNAMSKEDKKSLFAKTKAYFQKLKKAQTTDRAIVKNKRDLTKTNLFLILGFIPAFIGFLFGLIPSRLGKFITDTQVKSREFISSVLLGACLASFLVYLTVIVVLIARNDQWWLLIPVILMGACSYFYLYYKEVYQAWREDYYLHKLTDAEFQDFKTMREAIMEAFNKEQITKKS